MALTNEEQFEDAMSRMKSVYLEVSDTLRAVTSAPTIVWSEVFFSAYEEAKKAFNKTTHTE